MSTLSFSSSQMIEGFLSEKIPFSLLLPNVQIPIKPREALSKIRNVAAALLLAGEGVSLLLQKRSLRQFDARIGEERCQIRAFLIATSLQNQAFQGDLQQAKEDLQEVQTYFTLAERNLNQEPPVPLPAEKTELLGASLTELSLRRSLLVAIACFIISKTSQELAAPASLSPEGSIERHLPDHLRPGGRTICVEPAGCARKFVQELQKSLQKFVAQSSVCFLQEVAANLSYRQIGSIGITIDRDRPRYPFFYTNYLLFQQMKHSRVPILCIGHLIHPENGLLGKKAICFHIEEGEEAYKPNDRDFVDIAPAMVVEGSRLTNALCLEDAQQEFAAFMAEVGIRDFFLANSAAHCPRIEGSFESPDKAERELDEHFPDIAEQRALYQALAKDLGCIQGEKEGFLIRHVYAETVQEVLSSFAKESS